MKKTLVSLLTLLLFVFSLQTVFASFLDENRSPHFNFQIEMAGDLNSSSGVLIDNAQPGTVFKGSLKLNNPEEVDAVYRIQPSNGVVGSDGQFVLANLHESEGLGTWLKFEKTEVPLKGAGASEVIPFTITIPKDAEPGDYVSEITMILGEYSLSETLDPLEVENGSGARASATTAMSTSIVMNVAGDVVFDVQINDVKWENRKGQGYFVTLNLSNNSNVSVRPLAFVHLTDKADGEVFSQEFLYQVPMFSKVTSDQEFFLEELRELPYDKYNVDVEVYYLSEYEYFRYVNSHTPITKELMNKSGNASFSIWVLPLMTIYITVGISLFLIIVYIIFNFYRRSRSI